MKFNQIYDDNGTSLRAYAETLQEKAKEKGIIAVMVFVAKDGEHKGIHVISGMDGSPGRALIEVGRAMLEEPAEQQLLTPVSPGKSN
jgi:hypothetical protein